MKQFSAILFSALLMWVQLMPVLAATPANPCCDKVNMSQGATCCAGCRDCCKQSSPDSKPAPAAPTQSRTQNPTAILALAVVTLTLPENEPISSPPPSVTLLRAATSPLYARHCALLL